MASISLKHMFKSRLKAPLKNDRWSWGAQRPDGSIVLRVWQDKYEPVTKSFEVLTDVGCNGDDLTTRLGYSERVEHLKLIAAGAPAYLVMCIAKDVNVLPREIKDFEDQDVFIGGKIFSVGNKTYISFADRKPYQQI